MMQHDILTDILNQFSFGWIMQGNLSQHIETIISTKRLQILHREVKITGVVHIAEHGGVMATNVLLHDARQEVLLLWLLDNTVFL